MNGCLLQRLVLIWNLADDSYFKAVGQERDARSSNFQQGKQIGRQHQHKRELILCGSNVKSVAVPDLQAVQIVHHKA